METGKVDEDKYTVRVSKTKTTSSSGSWRIGSKWQTSLYVFHLFWHSSLEDLFWPLPGSRGLWSELAQARDAGWDEGWGSGLTLLVDGLWTSLLAMAGRAGIDPAAVGMTALCLCHHLGEESFPSDELRVTDCHVTKTSSPSLLWLKVASAFKSAFHYFRLFTQIRDLK